MLLRIRIRLLGLGSGLLLSSAIVACNAGAATPDASSAPPQPASAAQTQLNQMNDAQRVGQLIMMGIPATSAKPTDLALITQHHIGAVILHGNSKLGVERTAALTTQLQQAASGPRLFIATDQEGGKIQHLQGPGFSRIPSAAQQTQLGPDKLRQTTVEWAKQLKAAGVNVDLGPVLDTVPPGTQSNPPIGDLGREYGRSPADVSTYGLAVAKGLTEAGVAPTIKHFPGLGRVTGNPDFATKVTDTTTTRTDEYLKPFKDGIDAGIPFVMMSTAVYTQIDPSGPAAFSHVIVTDLLRGDLGFKGVIVSDDLGLAAQVKDIAPPERALRFIAAGGDLALTVRASQVPAITAALLKKVGADPAFKAQVDAAALRILEAKQALGLL